MQPPSPSLRLSSFFVCLRQTYGDGEGGLKKGGAAGYICFVGAAWLRNPSNQLDQSFYFFLLPQAPGGEIGATVNDKKILEVEAIM